MRKPPRRSRPAGNITADGNKLSVQSDVHVLDEDRAGVSRSKLEHIRDLADDERMQEPTWTLDRVVCALGGGLFFTALGVLLNPSQLDATSVIMCVAVILLGSILSVYSFGRDLCAVIKRRQYRSKLSKQVQTIIDQLDTLKAGKHEPKGSNSKR